ncbi:MULTISPECIES: general secretion pathway protein GspN [unclassified Pseudomonas]|uniref:general secretion pathway protein GspN n=1 Tax=unclassified Pseudomonas TaxID=196821 RepID=UPI0015A3ACDB|nr:MULTISPECIES: general secretion pathway protein GspN [unclassified Pseudomonas]NWC95869.1 general secretion pathway protein GspN [Pseudomonas sp. IPO3779]NWD20144.1 general secretion pathway protein GspN [Pseudomonas sp. IPO3778]
MINALRPLEWGLLGVAGLLGLLMVGILSSIGDAPQWLEEPASTVRANASAKDRVAPSATLDSLAGTWQAPLFSPDRRPDAAVGQAEISSLSSLTLSGVLLGSDLRVALLKRADGPPLNVHQGQTLPNGWRLEHLTPLHARFVRDGRTQTLSLSVPRLPPPSTTPPISLPHEPAP